MLVHAALLMTLALMTMPARLPEQRIVAVANPNSMEEIENLLDEEIDALDIEKFEGQRLQKLWRLAPQPQNSISHP